MSPDFDRLKAALSEEHIRAIFSRFGVEEFQDNGKYMTFPTICHNKTSAEAGFNLVYYKDTKLFRCFSECGETFDIFGLVRKRFEIEGENTHPHNLYYFVLNHSDLKFNAQNQPIIRELEAEVYKRQPIQFELPEYNSAVMDIFTKYYPIEWLNDGITKEAMDKFNIKYSIGRNSIIIPHYDVFGRLVGIRHRLLNEEQSLRYGKYMPVRVEKTLYNHPVGLNLYGLYQNKKDILETGIAIVAEGEKSCLQAESLMTKNVVVASCGNTLNKWQVLLLLKYTDVKEIIVAYDREEQLGSKAYYKRLYRMCEKYKNYCDVSFIYDNSLMEMKQSPFDKDAQTLQKLIDRRVKIK